MSKNLLLLHSGWRLSTESAKLSLISHTLASSVYNIDSSSTRTLTSKCIAPFIYGEVTAGTVGTDAESLGVPENPRSIGALFTLISCDTRGTSALIELVASICELVVVGHVNRRSGMQLVRIPSTMRSRKKLIINCHLC